MKRTINGRNALRPSQPHPHAAHWEQLRALKLAEQGNACACCPNDASSGYQLELHHRHYANWGEERPEDVVVLCSLCHEFITSRFRMTDEYKIEAGEYAPPRPGLPTVEIHADALPVPATPIARPGLPLPEQTAKETTINPAMPPRRIRPF
jgi:hypothetical protein